LSPCCLQKALNCQQPRQQRREASMEDVFIEIYHVQMERKTCGWLAKKDEIRLEKADEREREGERYIYINMNIYVYIYILYILLHTD
jgi:hypothetical protein